MFVSPRVDGDYGIIFLFLGGGGSGDYGIIMWSCVFKRKHSVPLISFKAYFKSQNRQYSYV